MSTRALGQQLAHLAAKVARQYLRERSGHRPRPVTRPAPTTPPEWRDGLESEPDAHSAAPYPGDYTGDIRAIQAVYRPQADGEPDAGEVVWAWVPYEDQPERGKDRPVLVVGHDGPWLLALMMTSKDHDRDAAQEAREGRLWMDIGTGAWDRRGRPSEVRLNRVLRLSPDAVRREGAALDQAVFARVAEALSTGW